ncbi:MAG TPA: hypothetical protein VFX98_16130, partial [Longimicrobiaceae bacterium]|nr:hypothetical protein [Longimicrobiaceae bacterium]
MLRPRFLTPLLAALLGAVPLSLDAQQPQGPARTDGRLWLEGYVTRLNLDTGGERAALEGVGGRVLWPLAGTRAAVGAFVSHTPGTFQRMEAWHLGGQADL